MNHYEINLKIKDILLLNTFLKEYEITFSEAYKLSSIAIIPVVS